LLGTPLTVGFFAQWAIITSLGQQASAWLPTLMVLALAVAVYGVLRVLIILFQEGASEQVVREPNWQRFVVALILLFAILLALFPKPFLDYAMHLAGSISS
jgi:NADH:ubiquinone oxidoreductase subunit 2 (subunit N)